MELSIYSDTLYKTEGISVILFLFMFSWDRNFYPSLLGSSNS